MVNGRWSTIGGIVLAMALSILTVPAPAGADVNVQPSTFNLQRSTTRRPDDRQGMLMEICSSLARTDMETTADFIVYGDSTERMNPLIAVIERSYRRGDIGIVELRALCQAPESFWTKARLTDLQAAAIIILEAGCILNNTRLPALNDRIYWTELVRGVGVCFGEGRVIGISASFRF